MDKRPVEFMIIVAGCQLVRCVYTVYSPHTSFSEARIPGDYVRGRLDSIDWAILKELQTDGSITNVELARRVGLSAPPCLRRVRALESAGIIRAYRAMLDPKLLGFEIVCFAMVQLSVQGKAELKGFEDRIRDWSMVRECWILSGDVDFILKCVATNLPAFQTFVSDLTSLPNVRNVRTALTLDMVKDEALVPLDELPEG
jgi:DNA-binding Lrp family transcriptional regulator